MVEFRKRNSAGREAKLESLWTLIESVGPMRTFTKKAARGVGTFVILVVHEETVRAFCSMSLECVFTTAVNTTRLGLFAFCRDVARLPASGALAEARSIFPLSWEDARIEHK